jgi:hypothetical protein
VQAAEVSKMQFQLTSDQNNPVCKIQRPPTSHNKLTALNMALRSSHTVALSKEDIKIALKNALML